MYKILTIVFILSVATETKAEELQIPPLHLDVPKPLTLTSNSIIPESTTLLAFTIDDYGTILKIATGYKLWAKNYPLQSKLEELYSLRLDICQEKIEVLENSNEILAKDREYAYQMSYKAETSGKLKLILYTGGGILVGTGIGIIIGALIVR